MTWKQKRDGMPQYGRDEPNVRPGLYLGLFHGFRTPEEYEEAVEQGEWGQEGPMIGPLAHVHTTYASDIKITFLEDVDAGCYRGVPGINLSENPGAVEGSLSFDIDAIVVDGVKYGDWTTYMVGQDGQIVTRGDPDMSPDAVIE